MLTFLFKSCILSLVAEIQQQADKIKYAGMAELADAYGSGPYDSNVMRVQVSFPARQKALRAYGVLFLHVAAVESAGSAQIRQGVWKMAEATAREQLIFDIAAREWEFFQQVQNTGGRASCQDDPDTFFKMRMSQWMVYSDETLRSYQEDLKEAAQEGRNPVFEKYGRMMETTYPEEYEQIRERLPKVSEKKREMVDRLAQIHVEWDRWMSAHYPNIRQNGRTFTAQEDSVSEGTSSESYLRGEMLTCSERTLEGILRETQAAYEKGGNLLKEIIANETAFYGYGSLEEAEAAHANA